MVGLLITWLGIIHLNMNLLLYSVWYLKVNINNINEGDILLSLRNLNLLVIIDKFTRNIKWFFQGGMKLQHSPRILRNGFIIVLDNQGSDKENGRSRILSINMETKSVESIYEAKNNDYFETMWRGRLQIFDNSIFINTYICCFVDIKLI